MEKRIQEEISFLLEEFHKANGMDVKRWRAIRGLCGCSEFSFQRKVLGRRELWSERMRKD